jgi:2-keto-3-deoxy-6-phosphogluconate aldolase/sugar/nucleoside kinase (ribokinase family)
MCFYLRHSHTATCLSLSLIIIMSAQKRQRRAEAHHTFVTMGESMLRFQPIDDAEVTSATRHMPQPFLRSVGGDELNVSVALSLLGVQAKWISVVPKGPLGDVLTESCKHHGVTFAGERVDGEVGIFTVLPEEGTVHYQRRQSAFALHDPKTLHWPSLLKTGGLPWLHVTGITPLISAPSRESWDAAIVEASALSIPISLDLNHRKQLGTLVELWAMVEPHLKCFELVILSLDQLVGLAELHNVDATALGAGGKDPSDEQCLRVMRELRAKTPLSDSKRVTLCRKTRRPDGVQRRWSLMVDASGATFSTHDLPIWHAPRDECGGGSAWAAGMIHALHIGWGDEQASTGDGHGLGLAPELAMRRADLLAAMCQESRGDFSRVTGAELRRTEDQFRGKEAWLPSAGGGAAAAAVVGAACARPSAEDARRAIEATLRGLRGCGTLAILRARGSVEVSVARGVELAAMGCSAMEVTLDSSDWKAILAGLRAALPSHVLLGVGTVMDDSVSQIGLAKQLGATFALSPIDPTGFVEECDRHGVLAVPSAFTSNECWALHRRGVRLIKLFHAGLASPAILKSMLDVGATLPGGFGSNLNIMPSGGVSPANAAAWLDAGALIVGMGSNLVGKDISTTPGTEVHEKAVGEWTDKGKATARTLFQQMDARFASLGHACQQ